MSDPVWSSLRQLARVYGIQPAYYDSNGQLQQATPAALLAVAKELGAPMKDLADAPAVVLHRRLALWRQPLAPVNVVWQGDPAGVDVRLPASLADANIAVRLELENGDRWTGGVGPESAPVVRRRMIEAESFVRRRIPLPTPLPIG